ncbi:hypothetical protein [Thalassospira mesophila]|uniref:hypothetical protein n=1 Tax=Thalassospira mesophila TaxID=1293891 RepID=UPI0011810000|nr:hypothetical protein [Thalassospira mesophila]
MLKSLRHLQVVSAGCQLCLPEGAPHMQIQPKSFLAVRVGKYYQHRERQCGTTSLFSHQIVIEWSTGCYCISIRGNGGYVAVLLIALFVHKHMTFQQDKDIDASARATAPIWVRDAGNALIATTVHQNDI